MPVTFTGTATKTFTRLALIKLQVDRVLTRCGMSESAVKSVLEGIQRKWIAEVMLYGIDRDGSCWAELHMKIDWARNQLHVTAGRKSVTIDSRWKDDLAVEVEKTMALFGEYVRDQRLAVKCHTRYAAGVDREYANRILGLVSASPVRWAGEPIGTHMTIPEIDEFTIGINLVDGP